MIQGSLGQGFECSYWLKLQAGFCILWWKQSIDLKSVRMCWTQTRRIDWCYWRLHSAQPPSWASDDVLNTCLIAMYNFTISVFL